MGGARRSPTRSLYIFVTRTRIKRRYAAKGRLIGARTCAVQVRGFVSVIWSHRHEYRKRVAALPASLVHSYCHSFLRKFASGNW
jgi:hypothetical protein